MLPTAAATLKHELVLAGSLLLQCADESKVPAGSALAVDRERFSALVSAKIMSHPNIEIVREEIRTLNISGRIDGEAVIVATGPLTSDELGLSIQHEMGSPALSFYDAAAPIVFADSLDFGLLFEQSRKNVNSSSDTAVGTKDETPACAKGEVLIGTQGGRPNGTGSGTLGGDYLNAALSRELYNELIDQLLAANRVEQKDFERRELFSACQPIEEVARSGKDAPRYGALKPVGLVDPKTGKRPWAVVQLRAENVERTAYNLVGFQTNLTFAEQSRIFRMIPGLADAQFARYGVMHRNTFIDTPRYLGKTLELRRDPLIRFAGQITGTEGYVEAIASGLYAAIFSYVDMAGLAPYELPQNSCFGSLLRYATDANTHNYQPMHVNYGIVDSLPDKIRSRQARYNAYSERAIRETKLSIEQRTDIWANS
jgi:methylenetetrahydrofolate--tRNA-(uracil-5-)-methyltransferase